MRRPAKKPMPRTSTAEIAAVIIVRAFISGRFLRFPCRDGQLYRRPDESQNKADEDADEDLRGEVQEETGEELVDPDYGDVVDGAMVWWRSEDAEVEEEAYAELVEE